MAVKGAVQYLDSEKVLYSIWTLKRPKIAYHCNTPIQLGVIAASAMFSPFFMSRTRIVLEKTFSNIHFLIL